MGEAEETDQILKESGAVKEWSLEEQEEGIVAVRAETGQEEIRSVSRQLFFAFAEKKKAILEMTSRRANLEDVFIELTEREDSENEVTEE